MSASSEDWDTIETWGKEQILGAHADIVGGTPASSSRVVGVYREFNVSPPLPGWPGVFGGEGVVFVGWDLVADEKVIAYYAGITAGINPLGPLAFVNSGAGAFEFTGRPPEMGGGAFGIQISAGVTAGVSTSIDLENTLLIVGGNISLGANVSGGYTYSVTSGGEQVYYFGYTNFEQRFTGHQVQDALNAVASNPWGRATLSIDHPDGVTIVQTFQRRSNGTTDGFEVYVVEKVLDADGNRLPHNEAREYMGDHSGVWSANYSNEQIELIQAGIECFAAGTLVAMADGSKKPIELIEPDDLVLAYDEFASGGRGKLRPARVVRAFANEADVVLDFHGLRVTPGHVTLCGDGPFAGRHRPLIDILRDDAAIVDRDGGLLRASTNLPVGSDGDRWVELACFLGTEASIPHREFIRLGTLLFAESDAPTRVSDLLEAQGYQLHEDGRVSRNGEPPRPLQWAGPPPKPEDFVLRSSGLTLEQLYDKSVGVQAGNTIN